MNLKQMIYLLFVCLFIFAGNVFAADNDSDVEPLPISREEIEATEKAVILEEEKSLIEYTVNVDIPDIPESLNIYKAQQLLNETLPDTPSDNIAKAFDFVGAKKRTNKKNGYVKSTMYVDQNNRSIEYFSSGAVFYINEELFSEKGDDLLISQGIPSKSAAKQTFATQAKKFIDDKGLSKANRYLRDVTFATAETFDVASKRVVSKK